MNKIKKKIIVIFSIAALLFITVILLFTDFIVPPKFVYFSFNNTGESGFALAKNIKKINLHKNDDKEFILNKIRYCNNLETLFISYNIDDFNFLDGVSLNQLYVLYDCQDWSSIKCIKDIKELHIIPIGKKSTFNDCSILQKFVSLDTLSINYETEIDFSGLKKMKHLSTLEINSSEIDLAKIPVLNRLKSLSISCGYDKDSDDNTFPENIELLKDTNIEKIRFWNTYIDDISFIYDLTNIKKIEFLDCGFSKKESEFQDLIKQLKKSGVEIIFQDSTFAS